MKRITKTLMIAALATAIAFSVVSCDMGTNGGSGGGGGGSEEILPTHSVGMEVIFSNHQVWERDYRTSYLSAVHFKNEGSIRIQPIVMVPDSDGLGDASPHVVGSGEIRDGFLSFNIIRLDDRHFMPPGYIDYIFLEWLYDYEGKEYPEPLTVNPPDVRANVLTILTPDLNILSLESFSEGVNYSIVGEFVNFIYVDTFTTIKSPVRALPGDNLYEALDLSLKPGWNMVVRKETYTAEGRSMYSMSVINYFEGFKWAIADPDGPDKMLDLWHRVFNNEDSE